MIFCGHFFGWVFVPFLEGLKGVSMDDLLNELNLTLDQGSEPVGFWVCNIIILLPSEFMIFWKFFSFGVQNQLIYLGITYRCKEGLVPEQVESSSVFFKK